MGNLDLRHVCVCDISRSRPTVLVARLDNPCATVQLGHIISYYTYAEM